MVRMNKYEQLKRKYIINVICFWSLTILFIIMSLFISYFFFMNYPFDRGKPNIIYDGLNKNETMQMDNIISKLKPSYLDLNRKIIITNNITKYGSNFGVEGRDGLIIFGFNRWQYSQITLQYSQSKYWMMNALCHEILHSIVVKPNEYFVYDLSNYLPCYNSSITIYQNE